MSHDPQSPSDAADFEPDDESTLRACEYPDCEEAGTRFAKDGWGNNCWVCEDHAEAIAHDSDERKGDEWYEQQKDD